MTNSSDITPSRLRSRILDTLGVPPALPWYVAFSGGVDSTVLLHCLSRIATPDTGIRLVALHADHGLSASSSAWRAHCEHQCRDWGVECRSTRLALDTDDRLGPEGRARHARYRWLVEVAGGSQGWLFTAHHRGDQAETVLERLTRGSGPRGLRAMQPVTRLYGTNVARPLLGFPRSAIQAYAEQHRLTWVTDESNDDARFTRNYVRQHVLPVLVQRWPDIETALARTADAMADAQTILEQAAEADLKSLDEHPVRGDRGLCLEPLRALDAARQRNVLRCWIHRELGVSPGSRRLNRVMRAIERYPEPLGGMKWPPIDLRIYRDRLYLVRAVELPATERCWDLEAELGVGRDIVLRPRKTIGQGLKEEVVANGVTVAFRQGGEKCRLPGRRHRHTLKHLLQEAAVPPWQRSRIPLITVNGEIAAVTGLTYCDPYAAGPDENGVEIELVHQYQPE